MKKALAVIVVLLVVAGVAWYLLNRHKAAPQATDLLPDTTLLYVAMPDFPKSRDKFRQTQIYALWQEPEVQALLEKPLTALREMLGTDKSINDLLGDQLLGLLQGETFLAVTHISPLPVVSAGLILGTDVKQKRLEARGFLKYAEHNLAHRFPGATATDKSYLGSAYTIWQLRQNLQVCHAFLNSLIIFTLDENTMRDVITRFAGQAPADEKPLSASPRFQNALNPMPAAHEVVAFLNVEQLLGLFGPLLALAPQSGGGMLQRLGQIQASAASVTFADGLVEDVNLVAYTGTNHHAATAIERHTLTLTSPDTSFYTARAQDLAATYRGAMDSIAQSGNATLRTAAGQFDRALSERGVRFADDVLANLGPETAVIATWHEGASLPDMALVSEVKDAAQLRPKLDNAMNALQDAAHRSSDVQEHLGATLHVMHFGASTVSPTYVVTDQFFILALNADYARALVAKVKNPGETLAGTADYRQAMQRLPTNATSLTYCDLRAVFGALYALARANTMTNQFVDLGKLPKTETLTRHLTPYVSATVEGDAMQTTTTYSPFGKPLTIVVGAAGVLGAAQPFLDRLPPGLIPALPTMSSGNRPAGNQTAPSQTPSP